MVLTDLDLEGDKLKATFNGEDTSKEDIHIIESVTILLRLALILNTTWNPPL